MIYLVVDPICKPLFRLVSGIVSQTLATKKVEEQNTYNSVDYPDENCLIEIGKSDFFGRMRSSSAIKGWFEVSP